MVNWKGERVVLCCVVVLVCGTKDDKKIEVRKMINEEPKNKSQKRKRIGFGENGQKTDENEKVVDPGYAKNQRSNGTGTMRRKTLLVL